MNIRIVCILMLMLCGLASAQVAPGFIAANQSISQAPGTGMSLTGQTSPTSNLWKITDTASVANNHTWHGNVHLTSTIYNFNYSGQARNLGTAQVPASGVGWTVSSGMTFNYTSNLAGIGQLISGNVIKNGAGDFAAIYLYPTWMGGDGAGSDEGQNGMSLNGGQPTSYFRGTVRTATGPGDTHPVLSFTPVTTLPSGETIRNRNAVSSWNYLIDTSDIVVSGNYAGNAKNSTMSKITLLPVSNSVAVDTGRCAFGNPSTISPRTNRAADGNTTDASPTLNQPISRTVTCWVMNGLHLSRGHAWIADDDANEQVNITEVTRNANGTDTVTFTAAQAHGTYAVFVQNPKIHGCLRSVTDYNLYQRDDDILVFGAYDPTHLEIGYRQGTQYGGAGWPFTGDTAAKNTDPYQVHPCAQILAVDQDGQLTQLEQNDIPFAAGATVSSPWPTSTHQSMLILRHNFESPNDPSVYGSVMTVNSTGPGFTGRASLLVLNALNPASYFTNAANPLTPPTGIRMYGNFTNDLVLQTPRHSLAPLSPQMCDSTVICLAYGLDAGVTNLCLLNSSAYALSICQNVAGGYWDFAGIKGSDIQASGIRVTGGTSATGSYLRYDGAHYIGAKIQMGDMPAAGITKTITITPTSGTCTLTVQNGLITGTKGC